MSAVLRKSALSQFGLKCREVRAARGKSLAEQAVGMQLLPSDISRVETGELVPNEDYINRLGAWLKLDALELSKFRVFARDKNNVVQFRPSRAHQESRKLFRKAHQLTPDQIRSLRPPSQDNK